MNKGQNPEPKVIDKKILRIVMDSSDLNGFKNMFDFKDVEVSAVNQDKKAAELIAEQALQFLNKIGEERYKIPRSKENEVAAGPTESSCNVMEYVVERGNVTLCGFILKQIIIAATAPEPASAVAPAAPAAPAANKNLRFLDYVNLESIKKSAVFKDSSVLLQLFDIAFIAKARDRVESLVDFIKDDIDASTYRELINKAIKLSDYHLLRAVLHHEIFKRLEKKLFPLHLLADCEDDKALLIEEFRQGLDINLIDPNGNSVTHLAARRGHKLIIGKISHEVDLNCRDKDGRKPIEVAALSGKFHIIKMLYAAGADVIPCIALVEEQAKQALGKDGEMLGSCKELLKKIKKLQGIECGPKLKSASLPHDHTLVTSATDKASEIINLAFKGGSVKGAAYLSAIQEAIKLKLFNLRDIKGFAGTSAGAITAVLLAMRLPLDKLADIITKQDFFIFLDYLTDEVKQMVESLAGQVSVGIDKMSYYQAASNIPVALRIKAVLDTNLGLCKGKALYDWLCVRIKEGLENSSLSNIAPENLTFRDLAEAEDFQSNLVVFGYNVSIGYLETYSAKTTPDMCVVDAVRCSMSIPGVFVPHQKWVFRNGKRQLATKVVIQDGVEKTVEDTDLIVDGGLAKNYPIRAFDDECQASQTLGFAVVDPDDHKKLEHGKVRQGMEIKKDSFLNYLFRLLHTAMFNQQNQDLEDGLDVWRSVLIDVHDVGMLEFKLTPDRLQLLLDEGINGVRNFIGRKQNLPINHLSPEVVSILFATGVIKDLGFRPIEANRGLTVVDIFKVYACAQEEELPHVKTLVNPNCFQKVGPAGNERSLCALQIARAYKYSTVEKRLIRCNANPDVPTLTREQIEALVKIDEHIRSGHEKIVMLSESERLSHKLVEHTQASSASSNALVRQHIQKITDTEARLTAQIESLRSTLKVRDETLRQKDGAIAQQRGLIEDKDQLLGVKEKAIERQFGLIKEQEQLLRERDEAMAQQFGVIKEKEQLLRERDETIVQLFRLIEEKNQLLVERDEEIARQRDLIEERDQLLSAREEAIAQQRGLIEEKDELLSQRAEEIDQQRDLIEEKEELMSGRNDEMNELDRILADRNQWIVRLERENADLIARLTAESQKSTFLLHRQTYAAKLRANIDELRVFTQRYIDRSTDQTVAYMNKPSESGMATANKHFTVWCSYADAIMQCFLSRLPDNTVKSEEEVKALYKQALEFLLEQLNAAPLQELMKKSGAKEFSYSRFVKDYIEYVKAQSTLLAPAQGLPGANQQALDGQLQQLVPVQGYASAVQRAGGSPIMMRGNVSVSVSNGAQFMNNNNSTNNNSN